MVIDFGGNAIIYGILAAMYPAFQLLGAPILGRWSDIYGQKKVLLISHGGTLLGWIFFHLHYFYQLRTFLTLVLIFFGTFVITLHYLYYFLLDLLMELQEAIFLENAYLDISSDENRSKNFGKMAISSNLGFIVGPSLAGILGATIYQEILPVLAALVLSLVTLIVIWFALKESKFTLAQLVVTQQILEKENIRKVFAQECKECYKIANPKNLNFKTFSS